MFDRFTDRARRVIVFAQNEARIHNGAYIGTDDLLLALVREGEGIATQVLQQLNVSLEEVRKAIQELVEPGDQESPMHIPFTPNTRLALEGAMRQALQLNHPYVGTEHLLLGLLALPPEVAERQMATRVLAEFGVNYECAREATIRLLHGYGLPSAQPPATPTTFADEPHSSGITLVVPTRVFDAFMKRIDGFDPASPEYRLILARFLEAQARRQRRLAGSLSAR